MDEEIRIRPARADDIEPILALMRMSLGEGSVPRSRAYWEWKHRENPFGFSPCLVATVGTELVGLRVFMRWNWTLDGKTVPSVRAVDTATRPAWRGQGIFSRLTRALLHVVEEEGVYFVFNTPNDKSRPGYLKMGWSDVGRISLWVRPVRPIRLLSHLRERQRPDSSVDSEGSESLDGLGSDPAGLARAAGIEEFLLAITTPPDRLATERTPDYLRWRFASVPDISYRAIWELAGSAGAAVLFRIKRRGSLCELRLCEVLVGAGATSSRIARGLIRDLIRQAPVDFVTAMTVTGARSAGLLGSLGFAPMPRVGPIMTARAVQNRSLGLELTRRASWHASTGDLELF